MAPNSRILVVSDFDRTLHDGDADLLVIGDDGQRNMDSATAGNFHWQVYVCLAVQCSADLPDG